MGKDCALDQVELEVLCHEFSDEALEIQAVPERDQPMRNTTLYYYYCTAVFFALGHSGTHDDFISTTCCLLRHGRLG